MFVEQPPEPVRPGCLSYLVAVVTAILSFVVTVSLSAGGLEEVGLPCGLVTFLAGCTYVVLRRNYPLGARILIALIAAGPASAVSAAFTIVLLAQ